MQHLSPPPLHPTMELGMTERQRHLLHLLVETYIRTGHQVPSGILARQLDLSPATVRYALINLEEAGLIHKPHASAGRIPTRDGLRQYALAQLPPQQLPSATQEQLAQIFERAEGHREVLLVQVASRLAGYPALLRLRPKQSPRFLQVHLSLLEAGQVLAVAVLADGRIREARLTLSFSPSEAQLLEAERQLCGHPLDRLRNQHSILQELFSQLQRALQQQGGIEEYREGMGLLLREPEAQNPEFLRQALELYERPSHDLLTPPGCFNVRIGEDGEVSLIQIGLASKESLGELTLLGPLRMRYPEALSVAYSLARIYSGSVP
jgi:heat-inducible transcriptional repressor